MNFRLHYRGPLKSNAGPADKHELRRHFHRQLSVLWTLPPLSQERAWVTDPEPVDIPEWIPPPPRTIFQEHGEFRFAPLICQKLSLLAELDVLLLRPQDPGAIVMAGGDIDNRLKTLLDALRVPSDPSDRRGLAPKEGEDPFFCLLEDDNLITALRVETDRLVEPDLGANEVLLILKVKTKVALPSPVNLSFV